MNACKSLENKCEILKGNFQVPKKEKSFQKKKHFKNFR